MSTEQLPKKILEVFDEVRKPLGFRQIEAHLVLKDIDVSTFAVQRAVGRLIEGGQLVETSDFLYEKKNGMSVNK